MPTVTTAAGGKISGLLALTMEADSALLQGDPVHIVGDYVVAKADGTKTVLGYVDVPNVKRTLGNFPTTDNPGVVAVEAKGFSVRKLTAGAAITAGVRVKVDATNRVIPAIAADTEQNGVVGIALMAAAGAASVLDVLIT